MRCAVALAAIPVLVWAAWPAPAPLTPTKVVSEGVRAQRQDTETFRARWQPVYLGPVRNEVRDRSTVGRTGEAKASSPTNRDDGSMFAPATLYRELPPAITRVDNAGDQRTAAGEQPTATSSSPRRRFVVHRVRLDVCARHGMRRVNYGKRWRCRR
jgi:hypothetical protein